MTYRGMEFASSVTEDRAQFSAGTTLQLAPHISETVKMALNDLPCFVGADTADLMREAMAKLGGKRKISESLHGNAGDRWNPRHQPSRVADSAQDAGHRDAAVREVIVRGGMYVQYLGACFTDRCLL